MVLGGAEGRRTPSPGVLGEADVDLNVTFALVRLSFSHNGGR